MSIRTRTRRARLVACAALVMTACSATHHPRTLPTVPTTTTADPPPTAPVGPTFPLTGMAMTDAAVLARPALSVKVDNAPPARPQSGLNAADLVTEELVEGGLSRLFVTFHSQDAALVGPVRSARPVDADLLRELGGGLFAYSGAAAGEIAPVRARSTATLLSDDAGDPGFHRDHSRVAPFNLYVSTPVLYQTGLRRTARHSPPPALFTYTDRPPSGSPAATAVSLVFGIRSASAWSWDGGAHRYQRTQDGTPDVLADGSPVTTDNIVILSVGTQGTGIFDTVHEEDPFVVVTGSGPCWVLRDGVVLRGTWQRSSYSTAMTLLGADGHPLALHPGRSWIELLPLPATPQFG
jgi:hypothetical protein